MQGARAMAAGAVIGVLCAVVAAWQRLGWGPVLSLLFMATTSIVCLCVTCYRLGRESTRE